MGIDFGSYYFKAVVLKDENIELHFYEKDIDTLQTLKSFIERLSSFFPDESFKVGITGQIEVKNLDSDSIHKTNEIIALSTGIETVYPEAKSIIEIGAQTSKFVLIEDGFVSEFSTNELCAAGTGSFIEQQAKRLKLSVEELSSLAVEAKKPAKIAGRCSVFAKSDMIHLQQKGTPVDEIAYGLCMAIARNSWVSLIKGKEIKPPVVIAGGCAKNKGIIRAFKELLKVEIYPSKFAGLELAIGSAIEAEKNTSQPIKIDELEEKLIRIIKTSGVSELHFKEKLKPSRKIRKKEPKEIFFEKKEGYIGIDIGSVSTDFVVIDKSGNIISAVYLPTRGKPVEVILEGLKILKERFKGGLEVLGCGVTGSGRYLAEKLVGADIVKNEITCQVLGTTYFFKDVDTIFEIGGQDSKYIYLKDGKIEDFTMNKICSAGTGSFLEEQSEQLGINIFTQFAKFSFSSDYPVALSSRCTVFMESEVSFARKKGLNTHDICAGLAYAIAENYLEKVVERRKIGNKIVFQGGVASNDAVVSAFEKILKKPIEVHPYNRISGAIGAAVSSKLYMKTNKSRFKGFELKVDKNIKTFECKACPNYCEVSLIKINGKKVFFGDACERFSSKDIYSKKSDIPNLQEEYISAYEKYFSSKSENSSKIGIPRASSLIGFLPFWVSFFRELGFEPVISEHTNEEILKKGVRNLPVGACLPVKIAAGHVVSLLEVGVDFVFIPAVVTLPGDNPQRAYGCPYTQSIPFMIKLSPQNFISPAIRMDQGEEEFVKSFDKYLQLLKISREKLSFAYRKAIETQNKFENKLRERGKKLINSKTNLKFAVLGRPYNLFDSYLNLNLFTHLKKLSVLAIPINYLPFDIKNVESELPWKFSSDILRMAKILVEHEDIYPIFVSNFGCGPDAFTLKQIEEIFKEKPYLFLEFDEHRGEAGLITRLEAFIDRVENIKKEKKKRSFFIMEKRESIKKDKIKDKKIYIPYFADHAYAFSGALKFCGYNAEVLPPPDKETKELGEFFSSGKECHAYSELLGDLVKLTRREKDEAIFFFPGTKIPCLLNQYGNGMNLFLKTHNIKNIKVYTPLTEDFMNLLGMEGAERLYKGLLAIDLLVKASSKIRPYEKEKGLTDKIHLENIKRIESSIEENSIIDALKYSLEKLNQIERFEYDGRPIVAVAGDIYTRANPSANNDLFKYLEEKGIEVWPSPFEIDIIDFGISKNFMESVYELNPSKFIVSAGILLKRAVETWKIRRVVSEKLEIKKEPGYKEVLKLSSPYMWNEKNELLLLNIAKIVSFAKEGADGIINAMCFNCMIGTASAAIVEKIKRDYKGIPIITLVYSGKEHPSLKTSLDAFIEQVKRRKREQSNLSVISQKERDDLFGFLPWK